MGTLKEQFFKQGGFSLIWDYFRNGVLGYAIIHFLLLGRRKQALEILRLGIGLKTANKLRKQFAVSLKKFEKNYVPESFHSNHSNKVWICWMQGIENAPILVQKCYQSLQKNFSDREIILITESNVKNYTNFPEHILKKYKEGKITNTHFSDLLRIELLCTYGGTWIDATVFCSGSNIPNFMIDSELFLFQNLRPGGEGKYLSVSSWFITSYSNNKILLAVRTLLWDYWLHNETLKSYFLLHVAISFVGECYADDWKKIVPYPNSFPHVLLLRLFETYDNKIWSALTDICPFHKLTYKRNKEEFEKEGTYYDAIFNV